MIYAQILNGIIVNVIELNDSSLVSTFAQGYDYCLEIDQLSPVPNIGWFYDIVSGNFFPPAIIALIDNNVVTGIINNCDAYITNNAGSHQYLVDVTSENPAVQVGFTYNSSNGDFIPNQTYYVNLIAEASVFGSGLMVQFAATNAGEGITQSGMTGAVLAYAQPLIPALTTGSLYEAITILNAMIADTSSTKVGAYATGTAPSLLSGTITFTAQHLGTIGNSISLTFSGLNSVSTVCSAWNTANPNNQVSYSSASNAIPEAKTVTLSGGLPTLAPYITNDVLYYYLNLIQDWLEIPETTNPGP